MFNQKHFFPFDFFFKSSFNFAGFGYKNTVSIKSGLFSGGSLSSDSFGSNGISY